MAVVITGHRMAQRADGTQFVVVDIANKEMDFRVSESGNLRGEIHKSSFPFNGSQADAERMIGTELPGKVVRTTGAEYTRKGADGKEFTSNIYWKYNPKAEAVVAPQQPVANKEIVS